MKRMKQAQLSTLITSECKRDPILLVHHSASQLPHELPIGRKQHAHEVTNLERFLVIRHDGFQKGLRLGMHRLPLKNLNLSELQ